VNRSLTATIIVPAIILTGAVWSGALLSPNTKPSDSTSGRKDPAATATLDKSAYTTGQTMTLTVKDNLWAKHTWKLSDTASASWSVASQDNKGAIFTAKAGTRGGTVTIVLTRTWDGASDSVSVSYAISGSTTTTSPTPTPTPTPTSSSPSPTPTPTSSSPSPTPTPTSTSTSSSTTAAWPGQIPGHFYLGMSCGTLCSDKESQLAQGYGVHRQYTSWGNWSGVAKDIQADAAAGRLPWISIKGPGGGPDGWQAVASGSYDAAIKDLATVLKANDDKPVLITFHHEPSNDGTEAQGVLWAGAYDRFHDVLKSEGALVNVADPPILGDWLFNPSNKTQDPANWVTAGVLQRAPFLGIDLYENSSGETFADRIPRVLDWMAARGYPNKMVGIGETGSTDSSYPVGAVDWLNQSLNWAAAHTDKVGVVSYFNSTNNSRSGVYWPLDETSAKLGAYRNWLNQAVTID
jgi:hypothetical protein